VIDTTPVDRATAAVFEEAEARAWRDCYLAAPPSTFTAGAVVLVHGPVCEPDAALCEFIVADGLANGARRFSADIEAPSDTLDTPAYEYFARLGFTRPHVRTHWTRL
jgi:hypothetical protein